MMISDLLPLLVIGLLGAGHCVGMCGGIVGMLGAVSGSNRKLPLALAYNLGRISGYGFAGVLFSAVAGLVSDWFDLQIYLRGFAALMIVLMGFYLAGWFNGLVWFEQAGAVVWRRLQPLSRNLLPVVDLKGGFVVGLIWGWLPCGLVYSALAYALTAPTPAQGGLMMLAFSLGTFPAMFAATMLSQRLAQWLADRRLRAVMGAMLIALGVWQMATLTQHIGHHGTDASNASEQSVDEDRHIHHH